MSEYSDATDAIIAKGQAAVQIMHDFANGDETTVIDTESGPLSSLQKFIFDNQAIINNYPELAQMLDDEVAARISGDGNLGTIKQDKAYDQTTITTRLGGIITPQEKGAVGNQIADDTAALNACLATGKTLNLVGGKNFRITSSLQVPSGVSITGDGSCTLWMDGAGFNQTVYAHATGSLLRFNACIGNTANGFKVKPMNWGSDLCGAPFGIQSSSNVKISKVDLSGFTKTSLVKIDSSFNCGIFRSDIHDCLLSSTTNGQLTGVDIDNNRVGGINSLSCFVEHNRIYNLNVSSAFLTSFGYQTDGINISSQTSLNHSIHGNRISNVGEGVDCFGSECLISANILVDCYNYALKAVHAARRNELTQNIIVRAGLAGIVIGGNYQDLNHTEKNHVHGNAIIATGTNQTTNRPNDTPWSASATAGIRLENDTPPVTAPVTPGYFARQNNIHDNFIIDNSSAKYGIIEMDLAALNKYQNNLIDGYSIYEFYSTVPLASQSFEYKSARPSRVKATSSSSISVGSSAATTVFNSELMDTNGEYDPATGIFTAKAPRTLQVSSSLLATASIAVGDVWTANIIKTTLAGVVTTERTKRTVSNNTSFMESDISLAIIQLNTGDKINRSSFNGSGTRSAVAGIAGTYLEIIEV